MSSDRILLILIVVVSILAAIPQLAVQFAYWGMVLVVLGLVAGGMGENNPAWLTPWKRFQALGAGGDE